MGTISTTIRINDAFSNTLDKLSAGLSKGQSGMQRLKSAFSQDVFKGASNSSNGFFKSMTGGVIAGNLISKGMALAGSGIRSMVSELNASSTAWQTFEGNMRQFGASGNQITNAKKDMQQYAQKTIYSASDMASTYAQLAAVGTKNTAQLVKGFGGLAAASDNPQQAMKTLSEQATQMAAKPMVQWQDFKLMLEQTPAGISAVAKTMGESTQQLIKDVQDGKVKTQDFLNAVAKTGTNANFSKMATQFKTVGQAFDGLKETLANKLQPQFDKISQVGIKAISGMTDKLANLNWDGLGNGLMKTIQFIKTNLSDAFSGFKESGALSSIGNMFNTISLAAGKLGKNLNKIGSGGSFFKQLGKLAGGALGGAADAISGIAKAISGFSPQGLAALAQSFILLKFGLKGLVIEAVVKGLQMLNKLNPGVITAVAQALTVLAASITVMAAAAKGIQMLKGLKDIFSSFKGLSSIGSATPTIPDAPKPGGILQSAGAFMKLGAALLMVGGAVALVAIGFKLIADTATQLVSAGGGAIAMFFGIIVVIALLAVLVRFLGSGMIAASVGFLMFGAAVFLIGAAIGIATAGIAMLGAQLPIISQYGASAAVGILALAGAIAVFGLGAIIGAVGVLLLSVALIALGIGALLASVGLLLLGVGLTLVAAMGMIAAVGMLLLGVALMMIGPMSLLAAVGMLMMAIAMVMIAPMAMLAAVGMLMLSVALILVGPMAMIAAIGLLLIAAATMILATGLAAVAAAAMACAGAIVAIGAAVMAMVSMFIAAGSMMVAAITSAMSRVVSAVSNGIQSAVSAARSFGSALVSVGRDLIQGLINGITSMIGAAVSAVSNVAKSVVSAAKGLLHIGSPSKLFRQYGRWVDQGLAIGLNDYASKAANASANMAQGVVDAASDMNPKLTMPLLSGNNPGDILTDSFAKARSSIYSVLSAITNLNGQNATVGVFGKTSFEDPQSIKDNVKLSSNGYNPITPDTLNSNSINTNTNNNKQVTIQPGAIQINSTGNASYDAESLLNKLEDAIMMQANKSLS